MLKKIVGKVRDAIKSLVPIGALNALYDDDEYQLGVQEPIEWTGPRPKCRTFDERQHAKRRRHLTAAMRRTQRREPKGRKLRCRRKRSAA